MKYIIKTFNDLTPKEIHQLYKARIDVFVVEQNCPYPDVDMHDLVSIHILLLNDCDELLAYCRVLPANTTFPTPIDWKSISFTKTQRLCIHGC